MALPSVSPEAVRELFTRFAAGEKVADIRRDLSLPRTTAQSLLRRNYAKEIVGEELFERVQVILDDPERMDHVRDMQASVHLLGRSVRCGICGRGMWIDSHPTSGLVLRCRQKSDHSIMLNLESAESTVEKFVLEHSRDPRFGELAREDDPVRAWEETYTLEQKRAIVRSALDLEIHRTPVGRTFLSPSIRIAWKK